MSPVQNITVDDRVSRAQFQYTLEDPDPEELDVMDEPFVAGLNQVAGNWRASRRISSLGGLR